MRRNAEVGLFTKPSIVQSESLRYNKKNSLIYEKYIIVKTQFFPDSVHSGTDFSAEWKLNTKKDSLPGPGVRAIEP